MGYCGFCGQYLNDGEVCTCQGAQQQNPYPTMGPNVNQGASQNWNQNWNQNNDQNWNQNGGQGWNQNGGQGWNQNGGQGWGQQPGRQGEGFTGYLKRLGFLDNMTYGHGKYEENAQIVPECLDLSDGEVPIKQFTVASMNNRFLGIPIEKAVGKIQVTNKRVIFRAAGAGIMGRTSRTQEFSVDELAGVTVQKRYIFQAWALFVGFLCFLAGAGVFGLLVLASVSSKSFDTIKTLILVFGIILGFAGLVPFFLTQKKWFLKTMALGTSLAAFIGMAIALKMLGRGDGAEFFGGVFTFFAVITGVILLVSIFVGALRPDLVLCFQGKTAAPAIAVSRVLKRTMGVLLSYTEILPYGDWETCVRELNAIINDVQKLGDYAVEKWKK